MASPSTLPREWLIYLVCLPLAIFIGYLLADPLRLEVILIIGAVLLLAASPLLLQWHHALLFLSWNTVMGLYLLPGRPPLWLAMTGVSTLFLLIGRAMQKQVQLVNVRAVTVPLLAFTAVVLVTMLARGGLGIQWLGSGALSGGRKYVYVLGAILGYFALSSVAVRPDRAGRYTGLFFLGGVTGFVGPLAIWLGGAAQALLFFFEPTEGLLEGDYVFRVKGMVFVGNAITSLMLARYGLSGVFKLSSPWRAALFLGGVCLGMLSGYRYWLALLAATMFLMFFLEGKHRSFGVVWWVSVPVLGLALLIPLAPYLPTSLQRSVAFLPVPVDPMVRWDAESTKIWRQELWALYEADIPHYFWLGKGMLVSTQEQDWADTMMRFGEESYYKSYLVGEHHNGFVSVIISFGVWGVVTFFWVLIAGFRLLYSNYRFGDPVVRPVNTFLLATYVPYLILFFTYAGTLYWQMKDITGFLGLSVALNGGICLRPRSGRSETAVERGEISRPVTSVGADGCSSPTDRLTATRYGPTRGQPGAEQARDVALR